MKTVKYPDGWWITGVPDDITECGPYDTRAEAEDILRGLSRFFKYEGRKGFITTDPPTCELTCADIESLKALCNLQEQ